MENNFQKINLICNVCGSDNIKFFAEKDSFKLYKCKKCGLIFVWPMPENLKDLYSQDYFGGAKHGFGYVNYEEDKSAMTSTFKFYLERIEKFSPQKGKMLDVGAATGFFIRLALERGWEASGIEISDYAVNIARKKDLNVISGTLENANFNPEIFDVVTLWDVIEHFSDPKFQLLLARNLLKNNGVIAINTPDAGSFIAKILGRHWHLLVPPEHLVIFNQKNLSLLLKSCGFDVLCTGKKGKKFTIQYAFQIFSNKLNLKFLVKIAEFLKNSSFGKLNIPINLRDNFFIIARKK